MIFISFCCPFCSCFYFYFLFVFLFQPKLSLFCKFLNVLFSFHSKICIWVLFGESPGFSPRWGPLSLSPSQFVQLCWATLYSSDHQASRNLFSGPFRIPAQTFSFFSPHYISVCLQNQAPKNVKCHRAVDHLLLTKSTSFKTYTGEIRK